MDIFPTRHSCYRRDPIMNLFLDTETTDFWNFNAEHNDPSQPPPCQVAFILETPEKRAVATVSLLINWGKEWPITERAQKCHNITQEMIDTFGVEPLVAWEMIKKFHDLAERIIGHNIPFDIGVLSRMAHLLNVVPLRNINYTCTMRESTTIVRIPKPSGSGYKWPNLSEAYFFFTKKKLSGAHDALVDVYGARAIFRALESR